ncbi:MAG: type II toxin-antitoxin system HicA family toxin [Nitrospirales bacterium]|nr:type II toxin-antitoxin system HicA family toxin [Nitrospirales bacterium]
MPKIPRDLSGRDLASLLNRFGYEITRQTGSHIRLTSNRNGKEHHITIPDHTPLKTGTLNNILKEIADSLKTNKQLLVKELFG